MRDPKKYEIGPKKIPFNTTKFWGWSFYGYIHSVIVFIIFYYMLRFNMFPNGMAVDFWDSGEMLMASIVFLVNVVIWRDFSNHTVAGDLLILLMLAIHVIFVYGMNLNNIDVLYLTFEDVWSSSHLYLGTFFACGLVFTVDKMVSSVYDLFSEKCSLMRKRRMICKEPKEESRVQI